MIYPFVYPVIKLSKRNKKTKIRKGGIFSSRSKPFAVSSESFQYEHGSQYGEYRVYNSKDISTLKRCSIGTNIYYGNDFSTMPNSLKSEGRKNINTLSDAQFRYLYGSHCKSSWDSHDSSVDTSYSNNWDKNYFQTHDCMKDEPNMVRSGPSENVRVYSNPPVLVCKGTRVRYKAPEASSVNIYSDDDYSKTYQREHKVNPYREKPRCEQRSIPFQENLPRECKIYCNGNYQGYSTHQQKLQKYIIGRSNSCVTGSHSAEAYFVNTSGKLVSYRIIKPKIIGAPVSVMVDFP